MINWFGTNPSDKYVTWCLDFDIDKNVKILEIEDLSNAFATGRATINHVKDNAFGLDYPYVCLTYDKDQLQDLFEYHNVYVTSDAAYDIMLEVFKDTILLDGGTLVNSS